MVCVAPVLPREKVRPETWWFNHFAHLSIKKVGLKSPHLDRVLRDLPFKKLYCSHSITAFRPSRKILSFIMRDLCCYWCGIEAVCLGLSALHPQQYRL